MLISSRAFGKSKEGSETKDTTVSLQHPTTQVVDDIVRHSKKLEKTFWSRDMSTNKTL